MQRRSSRGNPWHDERGRFASGPRAFLEKNDYDGACEHFGKKNLLKVSREDLEAYIAEKGLQRQYLAGKGTQYAFERDDDYYEARDKYRNGDISKQEMDELKKEYITTVESDHLFRASNGFVPAKTIEEAEEYTKSLGVKPYFDKIDLEMANSINESLTETFNEFPAARDKIRIVGNAQAINREMKAELTQAVIDNASYEGCYMSTEWAKKAASRAAGRVPGHVMAFYRRQASNNNRYNEVLEKYSGIYINEKRCTAAKAETAMRDSVKEKYHPEGCTTAKSLIDHECGHAIDDAYGIRSKVRDTYRLNIRNMKDNLSEYARENVGEFIAEGYCEYRNNPKPRALAMEIFNAMKEASK